MISIFPEPRIAPSNYNIFEVINFRLYEALPRWRPEDPDPFLCTNVYRRMTDVAWHSRYRTVYPHSLHYMALRAITLDDIDGLVGILKDPRFDIDCVVDKKYGLTSLQYAAMKNKFPIIELLLMYGANINKPDGEGNTPLMLAVSNQSLESINSLLKNGCDRQLANHYGMSPGQRAAEEETQHIADFISQYPQVIRKFPKFQVKLDIQKQIESPVSAFLSRWEVLTSRPLKNPFNNFKGEYRVVLNGSRSLRECLQQKGQKDLK